MSKLTVNVLPYVEYSTPDTFVNLETLGMERGSAGFFTFLERSRLDFSLIFSGLRDTDRLRMAEALPASSALPKRRSSRPAIFRQHSHLGIAMLTMTTMTTMMLMATIGTTRSTFH